MNKIRHHPLPRVQPASRRGAWALVDTAAELAGLSRDEIQVLIRRGEVGVDEIHRERYANLDDCMRIADERRRATHEH